MIIKLPNFKFGHLAPPEDSIAQKDNVFCVADGVTRDPKLPKKYHGDFTKINILNALKYYPNPSGAREAADICCKVFLAEAKKTQDIKKIFIQANAKIAKLNKRKIKKVDYLTDDYFGTVASGGIIKKQVLYFGYIGDCGLAIFNKTGKLKFQTKDGLELFHDYEKKVLLPQGLTWNMPERRYLIRSQYRNNPQQIVKGKLVSYGVLTGEKTAENFISTGQIKLAKGDLVIFYSDGFMDTIKQKQFFNKLHQAIKETSQKEFINFSSNLAEKNYEKYGHERSLIAIII